MEGSCTSFQGVGGTSIFGMHRPCNAGHPAPYPITASPGTHIPFR